jgi:hypothetical protein
VNCARLAGGLQEMRVRDRDREHIESRRAADAIEAPGRIPRDPEPIAVGGRGSGQVGKIYEPRLGGR